MRTSTVCCARTPNLEIAFFSGDFLPAGGAFPWRRQDGVPKGRKGLASPPGEAPPQAVMRGSHNHGYKEGFPPQYAPICGFSGMGEGVN